MTEGEYYVCPLCHIVHFFASYDYDARVCSRCKYPNETVVYLTLVEVK